VLIAFGLAWVLWAIPILGTNVSPRTPLFQLVILPGAFAPAFAAFVVRKWVTGEGFGDAGLRPHLQRWQPYAVGLLWPLVAVAVIVSLALLTGLDPGSVAAPLVGGTQPRCGCAPLPAALWLLIPVQLLIVAILATPIPWGEEFGWRGYLQVAVMRDRPLLAAVATGLIWDVWHYPLILAGYQFPDHRWLGLVVFPVSTVLMSIFLGWSRSWAGSVWAPSLAHSAANAVGGSLTLLLFLGGPNWIYVSYLGVLGWIPLGLLCTWISLTGRLHVIGVSLTPKCRPSPDSGQRNRR